MSKPKETASLQIYRQKNKKWSWRLLIDGDTRCTGTNDYETFKQARDCATACLSYTVYNEDTITVN